MRRRDFLKSIGLGSLALLLRKFSVEPEEVAEVMEGKVGSLSSQFGPPPASFLLDGPKIVNREDVQTYLRSALEMDNLNVYWPPAVDDTDYFGRCTADWYEDGNRYGAKVVWDLRQSGIDLEHIAGKLMWQIQYVRDGADKWMSPHVWEA